MAKALASYPSRAASWLQKNSGAVRDWIQFRCREETDLDGAKLHRAAVGYMKWCPLLACAASDALESRGWNNMKKFIDNDIVLALLSAAEETPVDGEEGMPSLLQMSFIVHDTIRRLNNAEAPLVDVDTKSPLQTGLIVLGESRGQQLDQVARQLATNAAIRFATDVIAAGEASLKKTPEHVPSLETVTDGGRELTALERSLVGRWIWQDFYTSGSFSARVELHMFLLPDGHCVRTSRSIASSTFYDNAGNWAGFADAESSLPPEDRGSWSATSALLALEMDDGSAYDYRYHVEGSKMTTRTSRGTKFWMRSRV
jgi:hypothetical protein